MTAELPEKPLSRKESYLAKIAGEDVTIPDEPESRTEQYLAYIAENGGGGGGTNNFNQLTNRPKYNGTTMTGSTNIPEVKTYTAGTNVSISDQNVISATDTTYSNFTGTDGTSAGAAGLVPAPATTDAGKFLKADGTWDTAGGGASYTAGDGIDITNAVISATNTGKAKVLTTDDYNWPVDNPDGVALWRLDAGCYISESLSVRVYFNANTAVSERNTLYLVGNNTGDRCPILKIATSLTSSQLYNTDTSSGDGFVFNPFVQVTNNLTSTVTTAALSAAQGKVLKDLVDSLAFKNAGAPTTATVGTVGQLLEDTTNGKLYICTAADTVTPSYTWTEVGAGGSGGGITKLTSADYNYPTESPTSVALWTLPAGLYYRDNSVAAYAGGINSLADGQNFIQVIKSSGSSSTQIDIMGTNSTANDGVYQLLQSFRVTSSGTIADFGGALTTSNLNQTTGTSTTDVMSQNAVTSMVFSDPETQHKIKIGYGASTSEGFNAIEIGYNSIATAPNGVALGSGTSAVSTNGATVIGANSLANGVGSIAISGGWQGAYAEGDGAINIGGGTSSRSVTGQGAISLGIFAPANSVQGKIEVGSTNTSYGYNSSNYRLLTGLYDGQSVHDAATLAQGNTLATSAPTTATVGVLGQLYTDTTNMHTYQCTAIDNTTDPQNPVYSWTQRW